MFKFPLKRHHHNNNNNPNHHHSKSASSRSNEGFIFIRCGHSANDSNSISNNNSNNNNSINNICTNNQRSIANQNNNNSNSNNNNKNVAKSTVQTSWRPQLPLPKEVHLSNENIQRNHHPHHHQLLQHQQEDDAVDDIQIIESDMERFHLSSSKKDSSLNGSQLSNASHNGSNSKKWSFGRLFRRKKDVESESSSDEDRKAGFVPQTQKYNRNSSNASIPNVNTSTPHKKSAKSSKSQNRGSKLMGSGFDHIVMSPTPGQSKAQNVNSSAMQHVDNEFFLPVETIPAEETQEPYYQNNQQLQDQNSTTQQQQKHLQQQRLHHSQQYLPHAPQTQQELMSRSAYSLDRRSAKAKQRAVAKMTNGSPVIKAKGSSSEAEEEIISLNSSTFSKYRSDESIHSGGQGNGNGQSRRSRAARNERYYKRLSRDGEVSHGQVPVMYAQQPTQRWKTQPVPLSIYQAPQQQLRQPAVPQQPQPQALLRNASQSSQYPKLRNTSSLQHMAPYVQWGQTQQQQPPKNLQNSVNDSKRSISYDSHIHLQNIGGRQQSKPLPPPPPPRDPLRRVNVNGHVQDGSSGDLRPMSYAFDQTGVPVLPTSGLNGRCVSDDKIWAQQPHYQSIHSLNITPNKGAPQQQVSQTNRRFITRAERDAHPGKKSLPNGLEFHYVADATPRSRKPIHMLEQATYGGDSTDGAPSGILRTTKSGLPTSPTKVNATEFWRRMEGSSQNVANVTTPTPAPRGRDQQRSAIESAMKPRSVSTSRVGELRAYPMPMYSEVHKPKNKPTPVKPSVSPNTAVDEVDAVVCGTLHIKPSQDKANNYVEIRNKDMNKAQSMPNHYHRRSDEIPTTPNKYEEYVNERREKHHNPLFDAPQPPQRKLSGVPNIPQLSFPRKKPANLEEAINELEAIYRSLGLSEETETKKERVATPNDFEKYALAHADDYDDEDSPAGEPDPIRDDVAYRNIKLANLQHKSFEKQPLFGIPIGPIVPAAQTDYLHVTPKRKELPLYDAKAPDVIKDDLAVRALRKDPQEGKEKFQYPSGSLVKKNRASRTQSANIYALIQRDAAKPSGGDFHSYLELTKNIDRSGSMSDIHKNNSNNDVPTTLKLLQNLREQDTEQTQLKKPQHHIPFRHPSQGGAICQLPEKLSSTKQEEIKPQKPIPMPRKSLTPEPQSHSETHKMEEALNKIAQDAQESSIKLTKELNELRKEASVTASKPKILHSEEERKLENELQEIEKVSEAAKKCSKMLLDTLPDCEESGSDVSKKSRKLHKEDKLIKAIDQVSEAANKVCEKILKDIVTTEPPVVVHEAVRVTQQPKEVKPKESSLVMPTLIKKLDPIQSTNIEAIARRCMRQLSDLADNHDYDNLNQPELAVATTCNMEQVTKDQTTNDLSTSNLTELRKPPKPRQQHVIEDIDQIMKECEDQARIQENKEKKQPMVKQQQQIQAPPSSATTTASSFSSSSDCLAKSSSPSGSRRFSSSITSFNPYSSSDYIKSPSSDFHAPSTDPIKTFSTTSYDVQSTTSATPNLTTISTFSYSPSPPPLNLTPISNCSATIASNTQRGRSSSPSQYNSSEELAMIFGIEEKSKTKKLHNNSESISDNSVSDLNSSNSATAKTSCQQPTQSKKLPKRYQGHHPHFHHHTAPAYYTDLHLKIHTPEAKDSVNENYQSVYRTPSKLIKDEHQFPKTATANVAPPPIPIGHKSTKEQDKSENASLRAAFFREDPAAPLEKRQNTNDHYMISKSKSQTATKGNNSPSNYVYVDEDSLPLRATPDGSVVFSCSNFKPCVTAEIETPPQILTGRTGRNTQRFANRKRAVRVRSESRPISALYDIICKEKGLDVATTTNDEDSSPQHSHDEKSLTAPKSRRSHSRSISRQAKSLVGSNNSNMSGSLGNNSSGVDHSAQHSRTAALQQTRTRNDKYSPNTIFINDLSDDEDNHLEGGCSRRNLNSKSSHKKANILNELKQSKSSSLPPGLVNPLKHPHDPRSENHNHDSLSDLAKTKESHIAVKSSSGSNRNVHHSPHDNYETSNPSLSSNSKALNVDSVHLHLSGSSSSQTLQEHEQQQTGAGTTSSSIKKQQQQQTKQKQKQDVHQSTATASPKSDRYSRKHSRRLRDEKPRRHTDGAIKLLPADSSDDYHNHGNDHDNDVDVDDHDHDDEDEDLAEHHHLHFLDLNGAGHDFHNLAGNTANAKRYITRSQRVHTHESTASPFLVQSSALVNAATPDQIPTDHHPSSTVTAIETNGHHPSVDEMTNNSGKNSTKTTATPTTATTTTTASAANVKELKIRIPLNSNSTASPSSSSLPPCSSSTASSTACPTIMSALTPQLMDHHYCVHQTKSPPKQNFNNLQTNLESYSQNNNNNYATPTASSVLKQRKQNSSSSCSTSSTIIPLSTCRKCPLSPLTITTNAPLFSTSSTSLSPRLRESQLSFHQPQQLAKLSPGSPILGHSLMSSSISPLSPNSSSSSVHFVRTTKTTRLRAAALDKKKDEEKLHQQRFTSPTSPKSQTLQQRASPSSSLDIQKATNGSDTEHNKMSSTNSSPTNRGMNRKLVPSVSVSMKQNLSEMHCTASKVNNSIRSNGTSTTKSAKQRPHTTECTVKVNASPKSKHKQQHPNTSLARDDDVDDVLIEINDLPSSQFEDGNVEPRLRCSTMYTDSSDKSKSSLSNGGQSNENFLELSPVHKSRTSARSPRRNEDRDKSSKRKSNLNRSQNEEATPDGDESALRRRRRRELGMSRPIVPNDDAALKALISPHKLRVQSPSKPAIRNDLAYHMEMARKGLDLATSSDRRRAQTASPKNPKESPSPKSIPNPSRISKRSDTVAIGDLRKERSNEVNRKMNERTRTGLEEIMKILKSTNESSADNLEATQEKEKVTETLALPSGGSEEKRPSPVKHATFMQEECIYYEPDPLEHCDQAYNGADHLKSGSMLRAQRMLKAKSIERETAAYVPAKLSPILRRKSTDDHSNSLFQGATASNTPNHIVSILKKKDHLSAGESSSASSNASPVTFSSSVVDTPSKHKRAGILKKRSSLDESRYYSRSHSPDERSILIKSARRNSLEEIANGSSSSSSAQGHPHHHHGILKQSSYDSTKSDGCPSASREPLQPHSILKKKDSTSTPSDGGDHAPKHVSISQAVILAAAELSAAVETGETPLNEDFTPNNEEYDIKPILKLDSSSADDYVKTPKPILKKKSSGDSDEHEIKPILKTSRKSSREEFDLPVYYDGGDSQQETSVRPILKTDSPSKRRSLGESESNSHPHHQQQQQQRESLSPSQLKRRTRSLERHDQPPVIDLGAALNAIATSQDLPNELMSTLTNSTAGNNISVAERIKSVEKFLANQSGLRSSPSENSTTAANTSWESPLQNDPNSSGVGGTVAGGGVKILKPSVIRRDLYKDRYKTQPVTSDEKNFFKNNVSAFDSLPSGLAFKPAQSLEGLGFAHLSSHGNQSPNAPPSAFTLTRSVTQPLQTLSTSINSPPQSSSSFKAGVPVPLPRKSPTRSLLNTHDSANLTLSFTGDSGLSGNSNSERIFEMSSLEQDVDMSENQDPRTPLNKDSSGSSASSGGVVRTNSVRARANMFQQMQEQTNNGTGSNREERTSPKRVPRRLSPSLAGNNNDEPKTPNNPPLNPDDEIEPSSLPLSERLRFFSSLSSANNRSSGSYTRSPPFNSIERCSSMGSYQFYMPSTPRSSTSLSSASVTPTPMESSPPVFMDSPTILRKGSGITNLVNGDETEPADFTDARQSIKSDIVKTSPFMQVTKPASATPAYLAVNETTPPSALTPTMRRIKLKTIGKLMMPSPFMRNDRNNNNSAKESAVNNSTTSATTATTNDSNAENDQPGPPKKIGKIKSPFIENCNQRQQNHQQLNTKCMKFDYNTKTQNNSALTSLENSTEHHSMEAATNNGGMAAVRKILSNSALQTNGHHNHNEDTNTDSGKENIDTSSTNLEQINPVVEIRRKFTRKTNTTQSFNNSAGSGLTRQQITPRSQSLNGPHSSPQINDKYAKYFGMATSGATSSSTKAIPPPLPKQPPPTTTASNQSQQENFGNDIYEIATTRSPSTQNPPQVMAINRNVRLWHSTSRGIKRMSSVIQELKKFEDIIVTETELDVAAKEFESLLHNDSILKRSSTDLEKIFSTII